MPAPGWDIAVAWSARLTGVWTVGRSRVGGADVVGGAFGGTTFDDVTGDVRKVTIVRGRTGDLGQMQQGRATLVLRDTDGTYNPENPTSPLAGLLVPMRPIRVRARGRRDYRRTVLNDAPAGYWRLDDASGTTAADSSGNGHDGTYTGPVTLGAPGVLVGDPNPAITLNNG